MPQDLIANARMYAVAPGAVAAWKRLFAWLVAESGVPLCRHRPCVPGETV